MKQANAKAKRKISDKERLDFLKKCRDFRLYLPSEKLWSCCLGNGHLLYGKTPRQAIDAAMRSGGEK